MKKRKANLFGDHSFMFAPRPTGTVLSGRRVYLSGVTVGQVKRAVGRSAKKVRLDAYGRVEVIFTPNGRVNGAIWALRKFNLYER